MKQDLSFMDSTGLRLVTEWHASSQLDGFELGVVPGPRAVQRVFELTGMREHLPFIVPEP